ncbi:MAG: hypothetical protein ABIJ81_01205 [Patescibacteria group bacterium]
MLNLRKSILLGSLATAIVLIVVTLIPPIALWAESGTTSASEEQVVISTSDQPLERQAKLKRAWIVYREVDSSDIYALMKSGGKRAIKTLDFFTAYNANYHIKIVKKGRLDNFITGDPITSMDGLSPEDFIKAPGKHRLVKVKNKAAVYLITPEGKKRVIIAEGVFHRFGWEFRDVEEISATELNSIPEDSAITDNTIFDEEIEVDTTHKRLEREKLNKRLNLRGKTMIRHRLVKAFDNPDVYVIDGQGRKHKITSEKAANKYRMNLHDITEVTQEELDAFPDSNEITETSTPVNLDEQVEN